MNKKLIIVSLIAFLFCLGCSQAIQNPTSQKSPTASTITSSGTIEKIEVSTWMYGTHILTDQNKVKYALESTSVDLDSLVNKQVEIKGTTVSGYPVENGPELLEVTQATPKN